MLNACIAASNCQLFIFAAWTSPISMQSLPKVHFVTDLGDNPFTFQLDILPEQLPAPLHAMTSHMHQTHAIMQKLHVVATEIF